MILRLNIGCKYVIQKDFSCALFDVFLYDIALTAGAVPGFRGTRAGTLQAKVAELARER
jgi:hypothetical protein